MSCRNEWAYQDYWSVLVNLLFLFVQRNVTANKHVCYIFIPATEYHLGLLKAKLAKYRSQLLEPTKKGGDKGEGFDVLKSGDARVALIGFPSVGKVRTTISQFLSLCIIFFNAESHDFFLLFIQKTKSFLGIIMWWVPRHFCI